MTRDVVRILFAIPQLDRDGPDRVIYELLTALDRARFAPSLVVSKPSGHYLRKLASDVPVTVLGDTGSLHERYPLLQVTRVIRAQAPDVVFSTLRMNLTVGVMAPLFRRRTKLIIRQANDFSTDFELLMQRSRLKHRVARRITLASMAHADAIVCQSNSMRDDLARMLAPTRLHVIGNPVDISEVTKVSSSQPATLPGSPALVSVGRLSVQKGHDVLLSALEMVQSKYPALHLTILGDGPERGALESLSARLGLSNAVTFAGFSENVLAAVRAADLFVLASRYEGFPNAALEALACGTPVVLTNCPGANSEIVQPGMNGRLAETVTPAAVANALERAIDELSQYDRQEVIASTEARYSRQRIVGLYEDLIDSLVHSQARTRTQVPL